MRKKSLDHDDISIWKKVTETVTPMLRQHFGGKASAKPDEDGQKTTFKKIPKVSVKASGSSSEKQVSFAPSAHSSAAKNDKKMAPIPADLNMPGYGGISRSGARSMKSGQSGYTRKIDLHGLTREKAQIKLRRFLEASAINGHRHVLVITGKGAEGKGVIKSYFPIWLNEAPLSTLVIAYCQAQPKDGGSGAWYVNLRL